MGGEEAREEPPEAPAVPGRAGLRIEVLEAVRMLEVRGEAASVRRVSDGGVSVVVAGAVAVAGPEGSRAARSAA